MCNLVSMFFPRRRKLQVLPKRRFLYHSEIRQIT